MFASLTPGRIASGLVAGLTLSLLLIVVINPFTALAAKRCGTVSIANADGSAYVARVVVRKGKVRCEHARKVVKSAWGMVRDGKAKRQKDGRFKVGRWRCNTYTFGAGMECWRGRGKTVTGEDVNWSK